MDNLGKELIQLFKSHRSFLSEKLGKIGLYPGQEGLLYHLSLNDGLTMSELAERMNIQHATLFTMAERMIKNNFILKHKDKLDKRTSRIFLTPTGKKKIKELSIVWRETEKKITNGMTQSEIRNFIEIAIKINKI